MNHVATNIDFLTQIIKTQSRLAEANFDLNAFMQLAAEQMQLLTPATGVVIELVEEDKMVYRAAVGTVAAHIGLRLNTLGSISGLCVSNNEILRSDDTETDSRVNLEACRKLGARSLVVAPLVHQGHPVGVLKVLSNKVNGFNETDVKTLQIMAGFVASGLAHQLFFEEKSRLLNERTQTLNELQKAQEQLRYLAQHDSLTTLPNRSFFNDALTNAMFKTNRTQSMLALMYLDIDHFKSINDNMGHDVGDEVLKIFSARIKQSIRIYDFAARLGGDEFVVILENLSNINDAAHIAKKIIDVVNEEVTIRNKRFSISTSIGVAFYRGENMPITQLIKQADEALYTAKKAGRNTYHLFNHFI